jgi:hypothetical protein
VLRGLNPRPGVSKGVRPLRGEHTRGLAPSVEAGEASTRAEPATERGSNPVGPATFSFSMGVLRAVNP